MSELRRKGAGFVDPDDPEDGWIRRCNALTEEMDDEYRGIHPAVAYKNNLPRMERFRAIVAAGGNGKPSRR